VPKHARRESLFFRELKKQDLHVGCDDVQLQKQSDDCSLEQDEGGPCDAVDSRPPQQQLQCVNDTQLTVQEPCPADADVDNDDDDITQFTSLQSRTCLSSIYLLVSLSQLLHYIKFKTV